MGNACGPSHLSSRTYNGQYGPFSGWYAVTRDGDSHLSCATCSTYCFWSNRTAEDPGGDPHQGTVSTFVSFQHSCLCVCVRARRRKMQALSSLYSRIVLHLRYTFSSLLFLLSVFLSLSLGRAPVFLAVAVTICRRLLASR